MSKYLFLLLLFMAIISLSLTDFKYHPPRLSIYLSDSLQSDRLKYIRMIELSIKGKEQMAVDSVFTNLKTLGGFPAENLVFAMEAWSKALGVSCGHCHNTDNFASDEINKKTIAREMVSLGTMVNDKLKTIEGLGQRPIVNCITCHRGDLKPALRLKDK
ncbi:MAG: photosynthetic reaction center cytochrome c subunit family protein [Saprospiraceae bacterium]